MNSKTQPANQSTAAPEVGTVRAGGGISAERGAPVVLPGLARESRRFFGRTPQRSAGGARRNFGPTHFAYRSVLFLFTLIAASLILPASAYPPAPFLLFYGTVRDEYGTPLSTTDARVILETATGVQVATMINPGIETAANYRLEVPMDSGLLAAPYQPTALRPFAPFRIKVQIGGVTYLPIEMAGDFSTLGQPGQRIRLNLTLGEDSNGDGLPDAWQRLINADLSKVKPGDSAGNGLTYLQEYYAGTYTINPTNGFALTIVGFTNSAPLLEFLAVTGRTYSLVGSRDLKVWTPQNFTVPADGTNAIVQPSYQADSIKKVQVQVVPLGSDLQATYFRLMLQ